jgi:predicted Zn-dependent protease
MKSIRFVAVCAMLVAVAMVGACTVSPEQELDIGAADAAKIDSEMPLIRDSVIVQYVSALGRSMATKTSRGDLDWHFSVVNSPEVNAFALPGGYIYVNRGAIEQADRLDELAGIMGHEIGHVVRRHSVKQIEQAEKGQVGVVLLCTLTHACRTLGGLIAIRIGEDAKTAHYSQHDEAEADSEGVVNTTRAGIDPEGLPSFFQKLLDTRKTQPTVVESFFSTHPTDQSRVAATRAQIAALPPVPAQNLMRDTPEFHDIQARVKTIPPPPKAPASPPR